MADRSSSIDLIRSLVRADAEAYRRHLDQLDDTGWAEFGMSVGAAFYLATRQHFGSAYDAADVIRLVADFRIDVAGVGFDVEPLVAERLIQAALTDDTKLVEDLAPGVIVETEMLMLWKLLGPLSDNELTLFFAEANALADRWS